jgi:hypothetical protein
MVKRFRNDFFGNFNEEFLQRNTALALSYIPTLTKGMVTYPVIGRSIRSKIATEMNTSVKLHIEPAESESRGSARPRKVSKPNEIHWVIITQYKKVEHEKPYFSEKFADKKNGTLTSKSTVSTSKLYRRGEEVGHDPEHTVMALEI